jgi:hypothetical protein
MLDAGAYCRDDPGHQRSTMGLMLCSKACPSSKGYPTELNQSAFCRVFVEEIVNDTSTN